MKKLAITVILLLLILFVTNRYGLSTPIKDLSKQTITSSSKPVILIVVDSLMDEPLQKAIKDGKAPAFEYLIKHGHYKPHIISSYPTMSVTIDSTLLTGTYANKHGVPGLVWYKKDENRLINYGSGPREVAKHGVKQVLKDSLYNLNQQHLSNNVKTINEELSKIHEDTASINGLIYRGQQNHTLNIPKLISAFHILPEKIKVNGPTLLSIGCLSQYNPQNRKHNNAWQLMGFNDSFTTNELKYLIENNKLPAFTLAYFPDLDHRVHKNGTMDQKGIKEVDQQLQSILNSYDSWDEAIQKGIWIVMGDSGQVPIGSNKKKAIIKLHSLLDGYRISMPGRPIKKEDQIVLAVNERMAYIYLLDKNITYDEIASQLKKDSRIGFIAWNEDNFNHVLASGSNQKLIFRPNGKMVDEYKQNWDLNGDVSVLDLFINNQNEIKYGHYPDALARLHGALHSHQGRFIIVDAKPDYEFIDAYSPTHLGGAGHGSLHREDSVTPVIIAGTDLLPKYNRIIDFKDWLIKLTK